jgi:hypothetical protein
MPPSTISSQTTSAAPRPVWGRAAAEFSILTLIAGRAATSSVGTPVSGHVSGIAGSGASPLSTTTGSEEKTLTTTTLLPAGAEQPTRSNSAATTAVSARVRALVRLTRPS